MKTKLSKIKLLLISCMAIIAVAFGALALSTDKLSVNAAGTKLTAGEYATDGSSMRIFKSAEDEEVTERQGLRFHVEMANGFPNDGNPIVNLSETNSNNGAFKLNEGFKTYTLILPTRLLTGDLTVTTDKVLMLDTSNFWYFDKDGNLESVAYVYNIPDHRYTDMFSYRGVVCNADGEVIYSTEIQQRCVVEIAKKSYDATINGDEDWGNEDRTNKALAALKSFIPTCTIVYQASDGATIKTEDVLWGDTPQDVPTGAFNAWYNEQTSAEVDVTESLKLDKSDTITLTATHATHFSLTGIADINNVEFNGQSYNGAKIYATLPLGTFPYDEEFDINAVNVEYQGNGTFKGLEKVFVLNEGNQDRIVFAFDSSEMITGAKIIIKGDSVFYIGGKMYQLDADYEIEYIRADNGNEDYSIFLGYIYNSDIKEVRNYTEDRDGDPSNGEEYKTIRVTFYEDVFINSDFTFENENLPEGYEFPVFIKCPQDGVNKQVLGGYYYWNDGEHQILELQAYGNHAQDELFGAPGTKLLQNGGYYIFEEEMYAYYRGDGDGINENDDEVWVVGKEIGKFNTASFEIIGTHASDTIETRFTTKDNVIDGVNYTGRWFNDGIQMTVENMSPTEPYAIYHTSAKGKITPITDFRYHGQEYDSGSHHQIFGLSGIQGTEAGEKITIIEGTRLWKGQEYWTATENIVMYYNGHDWIVGSDGSASSFVGIKDISNRNFNLVENDSLGNPVYKVRMTLTDERFDGKFGALKIESGSVKLNGTKYTSLHYHGGGNKLFEIVGDSSGYLGDDEYQDTITIEAGTRLWLDDYCLEFSEEISLIYVGDKMQDNGGNSLKYHWVPANNNTNVTNADVTRMYDATDAGGEVRIQIRDGIVVDDFYGFMSMDTSKGVPVVNGIEMPDQAFNYSQGNDLFAVRGGQYGAGYGNGAYISIPAGSVWYSPQGSFTFTEEIVGVYNGSEWLSGCNPSVLHETITNDHVERLYLQLDGDNAELRMQLSSDLTGFSYYGAIAMLGDVYLTKTSGTTVKTSYGYWYGGGSGAYTNDHSLVGFRSPGLSLVSDFAEGDVITLTKGTRIIFKKDNGLEGYNLVGEDISYVYVGGEWLNANLKSVTFTIGRASVVANGIAVANNGSVNNIQKGRDVTFTVTPDYGYHLVSVTAGSTVLNAVDGVYTYTVNSDATIDVQTAPNVYSTSLTVSNATVSGIANGSAINYDQAYSFTVTPDSGYAITSVMINGNEQGTSGSYSFTTTGDTSIVVETKLIYTVSWTNPTGATISVTANGNAITSGTKVLVGTQISVNVTQSASHNLLGVAINGNSVANNSTYTVNGDTTISATTQIKTFTVTATTAGGVSVSQASYVVEYGSSATFNLTVPSGAIIKANGTQISGNTYTVSNVTANSSVAFTTWYNVTVNEGNTNVSGITNGTLYEPNTTLNFTVTANSGYLLTGVTVNGVAVTEVDGAYTLTVNGNVTVATTTVKLTDISDTISIEYWAPNDVEDAYFFAIKANPETYIYVPAEMENKYWNDQADNIKGYNYGIDLMDYVYINGASIRNIVAQNAIDNAYVGTTFPFDVGGVYAPITLETSAEGTAGVWMKVMKTYASDLKITVKAGFILAGKDGTNYYLSKDVSIIFADGGMGQEVNDLWIGGSTKATVSGVTDGQKINFGETYNFTVTPATGYNLTSVTINDVEQGTSGSYSYVARNTSATIIVTTAPKTYTATVTTSNASVSGLTHNQTITHDQSYSFTVSANSGYRIKSVKINGTEQGTGGSYSFTASGATSVVVETQRIYTVNWTNPTGATISVTANGSTISDGATVDAGSSISVTAKASSGYRLNTVTIGGASQSGVSTSQAGSSTFNYTVNANTDISVATVKMYTVSWSAGTGTTVTCNTSGLSSGGWVDNGATVKFTINLKSNYKDLKVNDVAFAGGDYDVTVNGANVNVKATASYDASCLVEGTMVMMADGSMKLVDNVVAGDKVMVFNHETGKYEAGTIWFNDHANDPARLRNVINLEFANGTTARVAYEHGYFDLDLMRYVFIREDNMHEFIGHRFVTTTFNGTEIVQGETTLVRAYVTEEVVKVYGPITEYHFNLVTDEMLSMPSFNFGATGMVNIFEYDADLKYNAEMMQADIEAYGLFTYEEFAEYMSYEDYCKAPIAYFKVAIGKGNLTWEQIELTLNYLAVNEF